MANKLFQGVLFDMDGLLIDTENYWGKCMLSIAQKYGSPIIQNHFKETTGLRIYEVTEHWKIHYPWTADISSNSLAEEIIDDIIHTSKTNCILMPGVASLLQHLKNSGIKIGLATSSPARMMNALIQHFDIEKYFDATVSADETGLGKPHPSVFIRCAEKLNVPATDCIVLEDSINGMIAGLAARMRTIVVPAEHDYNHPAFAAAYKTISSLKVWNDDWLKF